jgi:DNA-binding response OmpR family regulator
MDPSPTAKILVVDDEPTLMTALCVALKAHGYATVGHSSANAALAELDNAEFDLLLTPWKQ